MYLIQVKDNLFTVSAGALARYAALDSSSILPETYFALRAHCGRGRPRSQ